MLRSAGGKVQAGHLDRLRRSLPLMLLGAAMVASDPWFTHIDDECTIVEFAARPARQTVDLFLTGAGQHEHPPLYDLVLHGWLRATGPRMRLLRLPSVVFFLAALWTLAQAAGELAGRRSANILMWTGALWPYGFHFGRLATWYSFTFLLVALLTMAYLRFVHAPTAGRWFWVFMGSLALVYANYFGWALLCCLTVDFAVRHRTELAKVWRPIVGTWFLLIVAYLPLWRAFLGEVRGGVRPGGYSWFSLVLLGVYSLYCLFVSESVAPWVWVLSVPAGIAVAASLVVAWLGAPAAARRLLTYSILLLALLTLLGIGNTRRLLLLAPWLLVPMAVTLATLGNRCLRRVLVLSLALAAGIGWFGTAARRYYGAPRWVEPWQELAADGAAAVRRGGVVIGNSPPLLFYLSYALAADQPRGSDPLGRLLRTAGYEGVYDPEQWRAAGRPVGRQTLLIKGLHFGTPEGPVRDAELWLDHSCPLEMTRRLVPDPGWKGKQRYFPQLGQLAWRIEVRRYTCAQGRK